MNDITSNQQQKVATEDYHPSHWHALRVRSNVAWLWWMDHPVVDGPVPNKWSKLFELVVAKKLRIARRFEQKP